MCACYGKSCNDSAKNIDEVGNSIKKFAPACSPEPSIRTRASVHASSWNRALKLYRMAFSKHFESLVVFVSRCSVGVDRRCCQVAQLVPQVVASALRPGISGSPRGDQASRSEQCLFLDPWAEKVKTRPNRGFLYSLFFFFVPINHSSRLYACRSCSWGGKKGKAKQQDCGDSNGIARTLGLCSRNLKVKSPADGNRCFASVIGS